MKSAIRIIKSHIQVRPELSVVDELKVHRQARREMVENVRSWVTQTKRRQREEEKKLAALLK